MSSTAHHTTDVEIGKEHFNFSATKKTLMIIGGVGLLLFIIGIVSLLFGGGHEAEAGHASAELGEAGHAEFHWYQRLFANLWINNVYFTGLSIIGVFFVAFNYAAQAGWSAGIKRVPEAFGAWLPVAGVLMLVVFLFGSHSIFHWTHDYLYDEADPRYDAIIAGKQAYLNTPFYLIRMVAYFGLWFWMWRLLRRESLAEDTERRHQALL